MRYGVSIEPPSRCTGLSAGMQHATADRSGAGAHRAAHRSLPRRPVAHPFAFVPSNTTTQYHTHAAVSSEALSALASLCCVGQAKSASANFSVVACGLQSFSGASGATLFCTHQTFKVSVNATHRRTAARARGRSVLRRGQILLLLLGPAPLLDDVCVGADVAIDCKE